MRGQDAQQEAMFSYVSPDARVPADHPLRKVREIVDRILKELSPRFSKVYAEVGRPSIAPERLLRALLLQIFYSIRSERLLMEQLDYNLLFRWFVGMEMDEAVWKHAVFSKNRERLLNPQLAEAFFGRVLQEARPYTSDEHFTVDGTLIEAWASQKSFRPKGENHQDLPSGENFHGQKRRNDTHQSTTDPEARLYRKSNGSEARLSYLGHIAVEHRNGLIVGARVTQAHGTAEREAAQKIARRLRKRRRITVAGDKAYDTRDFVGALRDLKITPHVAQNTSGRSSAIDQRTTRRPGYTASQRKRRLVEKPFGWMKVVGLLRKVKLRGLQKVGWLFVFTASAFNLWRIPKLQEAVA